MDGGRRKNKKGNVAFVIGHLSHGGAEKQLYLLCRGLDKNRYNPIVFCLSKTSHPWGNRISGLGIPVIYISRLSRFDVTRVVRLTWYFYKYGINGIISSLHIANIYCWISKLFYLKKTWYIAQVRSIESNMNRLEKFLNTVAFNSADAVIINSKLMYSFVEEMFRQKKNKIIAINNGIDIQRSKKQINNTGVIRIGTIGKDTYFKNIGFFIELALFLLSIYDNLHFHICGRGLDNDARFLNNIQEKYRAYFTFHGEVDDPHSIYQILDLYVSTSLSEGTPNTIMEAMAFGLPVVATNVGGVSEIVHNGDTGFLVPSNDFYELTKYCQMLIEDNDLRSKMGQKGRSFISKNYSSEIMVRQFEEVFKSILKGHNNV